MQRLLRARMAAAKLLQSDDLQPQAPAPEVKQELAKTFKPEPKLVEKPEVAE
jgi:hypothetical protein